MLDVETVIDGLTIPWGLAFAPDGALLFTERPGPLSVYGPPDAPGTSRVLAVPDDLFVSSETGLMGVAVDPDFATNRTIYTCQGFDDGVTRDIRVVRRQVDAGYTSAPEVGNVVVGIPTTSGRHGGCRVGFARGDAQLWITTGDAAEGTHPQDLTSLGGKVLRVDPVTGEGSPGNPFAADANPNTRRIYTYGHRNIQGFAPRPGTDQVFIVEHGPDRDDEVNLLAAGGNYGWDPVPNYNELVPMTDTTKFPNAVEAVWNSGFPTLATSGGTFVTGAQWQAWDGALIVAALKTQHLHVFTLDADGRPIGEARALEGQEGRLRTARQGPDGNLYVATSNGAGADKTPPA